MKIIICTLVCIIFYTNDSIASEYDEWLKKQKQEYTTYKKTIDEKFKTMLKQDWEKFQLNYNPTTYKKKKPTKQPTIKKASQLKSLDLNNSKIVNLKPNKKINKEIKTSIPVKIKNGAKIKQYLFFGQDIKISYDKNITNKRKIISQESINYFWNKISKQNYQPLIDQVNNYIDNLSLNDWGKYLFIYNLGLQIHNDQNDANLFTWFILNKMGYNAKVAYNDQKIHLLVTLTHKIYQVSFLKSNDMQYYILTPNGKINNIGSLKTYKGFYKKNLKSLSFKITNKISFNKNLKKKNIVFKYKNEQYVLEVDYDKNLIDFYQTFPQADYDVYFHSVSTLSLLENIRPLINGKTELEAVNFLLRFVQTSFKYATDYEQFKYEKVFFPSETLFYPYSDCEDRSIMFHYLVTNLLNLEVIGLKYSNHLATAVKLSSKVNGENFKINNKIYTVADPTFINANIGEGMPQYKNKMPEFIF